MSEKDIVRILASARFKFRSDTLENWSKLNPILLSGEFGVVTNGTETDKVKIGDGITPWNELGWWKGPKGDTGPQGEQGPEGPQGIPGSATPQFISMVEQTEENAQKTEQAYSDFLNQLGTDVATLVGGKIPMNQIPATATQEIYTVTSEAELTSLTAQRGDLAELIEKIDGERTITKTWQCLGDSSKRDNWVVWGTSYAVSAGNATTATNAENANTINNHRLIEISAEEFETAVKDENTYYLVY